MIPLWLIHEKITIYYKVDVMTPFKSNRQGESIYLRQVFHYLARTLNGKVMSYERIGNYYSDVSGSKWTHATVMSSIKKIEGYLEHDKTLKREIEELKAMFPKKTA